MTELKKKVITINREHLNPSLSSQKRNSSVKKNRKLPGFIKPSELKNNLIKLLKQKREETKNTTNESNVEHVSIQNRFSKNNNNGNNNNNNNNNNGNNNNGNKNNKNNQQQQQQPFNRQKYTDIFSKDFEASLDYLKTFKRNAHPSSTRKHHSQQQQQPEDTQFGVNNFQNVTLDVPSDLTLPISLNIPGMNATTTKKHESFVASPLQQQLQELHQ